MMIHSHSFKIRQNRLRKHRQSWQNTLIYLMASLLTLGMTCYTPGNAQAESRTSQPVVQKLDSPALQLYTAGVQMAPLIPDLLGFTKPKSYLLLVQNNQELRATGGFITAVGKLTVANGRITSINFVDSFNIAPNNVDHPLAPDPLKRFMDIPILFLRDANWSPDFPTSARMASSIYAQDTGVQVDGVITIDLRAVQFLVGALAPLQIPGSDVPLTADNVIQEMLTLRENPLENGSPQGKSNPAPTDGSWYLQRKDFIPLMAEAALARLQSGRFSIFRLINAVTSSLDERAVQIW